MARPTKYNPERAALILETIKVGGSREGAAKRAGITYHTLLNWIKEGEAAKTGGLFKFFDAFTRAEADAELRNVTSVQKAATEHDAVTMTETTKTVYKIKKTRKPDGTVIEEPVALEETSRVRSVRREYDWRAAAWWLERRMPDQYRERKSIDLSDLSDEQLLRLLAAEEGSDPAGPDPEP